MEGVFLEHVFGYMKEKRGTGSGQHGFAKARSCLTSLVAFHDRFVNKGRTVAVSSDFSKAFSTVSHNTLVSELGCYSVDGWTTRWVKICSYSTWRPVTSGVLKNSIVWPV